MIKLTDQNFAEVISQTEKKPLLVDFWTSRQEACRYNAPVADEISRESGSIVTVGKVNVDECPYLIGTYQIDCVPSMAVFHKGKLESRLPGVVTKECVMAVLKEKGI